MPPPSKQFPADVRRVVTSGIDDGSGDEVRLTEGG